MRSTWSSTNVARYALVLGVFLFAFTAVGAESASAISRNEVLTRAQKRVDLPVPYSQLKNYAGYRTDCSGYVSMAWKTGGSYSTRSFHLVTKRIRTSELKPGDALLKAGYHIRLFYRWLDEDQTRYVAYESAYGKVAGVRVHSIADDLAFGYVPVRYDRISGSPSSRNLLHNGGFDSWAKSWSVQADQPLWWQATGSSWGQLVASRRLDTYRTRRNALEFSNPSDDPDSRTHISQSVRVRPGAEYRLTAYARTPSDPQAVEMHLAYLDASGASLAETMTAGTVAGLSDLSYRRLSLLATAPAETVIARVSISLAGGATTDTAGVLRPGTSVLLDDISLVRPQVTVGMKTSASSARNGTRVTLSGTVKPALAVGGPAVVHVKRPGGSWQRLRTVTVAPSGTAGAWSTTYRFKRTMPRGTYRFKTSVPAIPGYLGATSRAVKVTLR
jgi:hypothetical protein